MQNLSIQFTYPWLLLLIIPAIGLALIPYFRMAKKYRRTRNRITSVVLHSVIMVLCIFVLSGVQFTYQIPNENNEVILLVDLSETEEQSKDDRDEFIQNVIATGRYDNVKMGVVTFGFDQVYAVPITDDLDSIYATYQEAETPDVSGTDIAAALTYAKDLFDNPETGKIVLITDGKETDESADTVIKAIAAQGIGIDTVYISSDYAYKDVQIIGVTMPDYHINVGDECTITYTVQGNSANMSIVRMYDNGKQVNMDQIDVVEGTQSFSMTHTFEEEGMHQIVFEVRSSYDSITENNTYYSYIYLDVFNNVLVLERSQGESESLKELLTQDEKYQVTVKNIRTDDDVPSTIEELCEYDQVILNNIANKDMPAGFDSLLYTYVNDYGGGLFTLGGNDESGNANAYNRDDMYGTLYQQLLPVQAINYTPPVGVIVIIDRSGSMSESFGSGDSTKLDYARAGATACLDALTERDYFGLMTLDTDYNTILPLTECTKDNVIRNAIASVNEATGGTVYPGAIDRAGQALRALTNVARRHIIIVSDGEVPESQRDSYIAYIQNYYKNDGITVSVVGIGVSENSDSAAKMAEVVEEGHGRLYTVTKSSELIKSIREDINAPEIKEVNYETFTPTIYNSVSSILNGITLTEEGTLPFTLDGFYGVKVRNASYLVLVGDYNVPIYAQWKYGKGMVGSFMCDLNGTWSSNLFATDGGNQLILNMINSLMPVEQIKPNEFNVEIKEGNYINQLSVYADLDEGERIEGTIASVDGEINLSLNSVAQTEESTNDKCYITVALSATNNYSRSTFIIKRAGVYLITLNKLNAAGEVLATYQTYKQFSYSEEYNIALEQTETDLVASMYSLAEKGNGNVIVDLDNPLEIFENFVTSINQVYDPSMILIIIAICLFLLDVAVRKFKFKWIHELIADYKNKKSSNQ